MGLRRGWFAVVAAGLLALTACADDPGEAAGEAGSSTDLSFTVPTVDGEDFDGASLAGRPALLWFWAPWCVVCAGQAPGVSQLAEAYDGQVTVLGVAGLDDSVDNMRDFITRTGVERIAHLADAEGVVWQRFDVTAQSTFVILDADGAVVDRGGLRPDEISAHLDPLVD